MPPGERPKSLAFVWKKTRAPGATPRKRRSSLRAPSPRTLPVTCVPWPSGSLPSLNRRTLSGVYMASHGWGEMAITRARRPGWKGSAPSWPR